MNKLPLPEDFSKRIFNFSYKFTKSLRKQQKGNFREIVRGLILSGSSFLTQIAATNAKQNNVRKDVERLSNTLSKINVDEMEQIHIDSKIDRFRNEAVLILSDGGDIQKPFAKKMEKVCKNVDGSNSHKPGKGYFLHSMVAYGVKSKSMSILSNHLYSSETEDFRSGWHEEKQMFNKLENLIVSSVFDRIVVEDRGCDDEKRFLYFVNELECSFVTRIHAGNRSRMFMIQTENGEFENMKVKEIAEKLKSKSGAKRQWWNQKLKMNLTSKIAFQKVYLPEHLDIPLYAIFCYSEGHNEPLVILTDLTTEDFEIAWKHFFYYKKRWEVENFYRGMKQSFGAEKFKIQDYEKVRALAFLIMLAYDFLLILKRQIKKFSAIFLSMFMAFCNRTQKEENHHLSLLAFLREEFVFLNPLGTYRFCSLKIQQYRYQSTKNQLSLLNFSQKW